MIYWATQIGGEDGGENRVSCTSLLDSDVRESFVYILYFAPPAGGIPDVSDVDVTEAVHHQRCPEMSM